MIFISLGTQKFQFNRLLKIVDSLIDEGIITDSVFAQIGHSNYNPRNYETIRFMSQHDFHEKIRCCDIYITHGGVGSIRNGLKFKKNIIIFPRIAELKEHIDNHQIEISKKYFDLGIVSMCLNKEELKYELINFKNKKNFEYIISDNQISDAIISFIEKERKK